MARTSLIDEIDEAEIGGPSEGIRSRRSRIVRYTLLLVWMALIFLASTNEFSATNTAGVLQPLLRWFFPHLSNERFELVHLAVRKAGHLTEYAILAVLAARAFGAASGAWPRRHWFVASLILVAAYALSDEYHQSFIPTRTASIYDSLIDTVGGLIGLIILTARRAIRSRKSPPRRVSSGPLAHQR